jgi:oligoribonuclease
MNAAAAPSRSSADVPATPELKKSDQNLIWLDCEMSGLDPKVNRLLEVAVVITNADLSVRVESPVIVIHQSDAHMAKMDKWNRSTHGKSGLTAKVRASKITNPKGEEQLLAFIKKYVPRSKSPMCGNTIGQDRRFLARYMPKLEAYFHYRNLDVSTLKELAKRWKPELHAGFKKQQAHTALADVHESIDELIYYRERFLKM